jgi:thioredoxin-like negative regulator of GroEL
MLQDVQPDELNITDGPTLVYFYTPFCGTCAAAKKMLNLALEASEIECPAFSCDLNFAPHLAEKWEIQSVPCLIWFCDGEAKKKVYAFHSVSFLFDWFKSDM